MMTVEDPDKNRLIYQKKVVHQFYFLFLSNSQTILLYYKLHFFPINSWLLFFILDLSLSTFYNT